MNAMPPPAPLPAAIVTASYAPDFERCRLLCETVDRHVSGHRHHYILVAGGDVKLFRSLEAPGRTVIDERDLLPHWLRSWPDPSSLFRRRVWLSVRTSPLRGWHVQQLRRIAVAAHLSEETLVYCDSDVAFVRDFDCGVFWSGGRTRLFRMDNALARPTGFDHLVWSANAARILGVEPEAASLHDYIATLIAWRRRTVLDMCARIEDRHGRSWVETLGRTRRFSECILYGRYVDDVTGGADHFHSSEGFCRIYWEGPALSDEKFSLFLRQMSPSHAAIGVQSFVGTDIRRIRRLIEAA
jgi:hypothetical protein